MEIIDEFLEQYNRQYDFYSELARIGYNKLESELAKRGIKAIVSHRAKRPDRLRDKLIKRNTKKKYKSIQDIYTDIVDLAGIRVALYFPADRDLVDEIIKEIFNDVKPKIFPEKTQEPKYSKRFSGYWATHYRVQIKKSEKEHKRYQNTTFEIQVASVLMHAWAEVEHDLAYKPLSGTLSDEELSILDEINGLVLSGEIALERLQKAITKRTKESKSIMDRYELTNLITNSLNKNYLNKLKLGDTKTLNNYFNTVVKLDPDTISNYLKNINQSVDETISDQLLNMWMQDIKLDFKNISFKDYFARAIGSNKDTKGFEAFIKSWIILEKTFKEIINELEIPDRTKKYNVPRFELLFEKGLLSKQESYELQKFRQIRNQLLHGIETPDDTYLIEVYGRLKEITQKLINNLKNEEKRTLFNKEINEI